MNIFVFLDKKEGIFYPYLSNAGDVPKKAIIDAAKNHNKNQSQAKAETDKFIHVPAEADLELIAVIHDKGLPGLVAGANILNGSTVIFCAPKDETNQPEFKVLD